MNYDANSHTSSYKKLTVNVYLVVWEQNKRWLWLGASLNNSNWISSQIKTRRRGSV